MVNLYLCNLRVNGKGTSVLCMLKLPKNNHLPVKALKNGNFWKGMIWTSDFSVLNILECSCSVLCFFNQTKHGPKFKSCKWLKHTEKDGERVLGGREETLCLLDHTAI